MSFDNKRNRRDVLVLFGETNPQLKVSLRQSLKTEGFETVREVDSDGGIRDLLSFESPDIAILDGGMRGDIVGTIAKIRRGQLGHNPYFAIILTTWSADADLIRRMMNSGADEILLKPLSVTSLMERVSSLVSRRKPYLATKDYIGPDRRGGRDDPNAVGVQLIHPPNTLKAKLEGAPISKGELIAKIRETQVGMAEQRLQRDIARIVNLSRAIHDASLNGRRDRQLFSELDQLAALGVDLKEEMEKTAFAAISEIFMTLHRTAVTLRDALPALDEKTVKLLAPLSDSIVAAIASPEARRQIAEVAATVREFQGQQAEAPSPASG